MFMTLQVYNKMNKQHARIKHNYTLTNIDNRQMNAC